MKYLYLSLVYSSPFLVAFLPYDWFQGIWLWAYIPFAAVAIIFVSIRPDKEMLLWVCASPFIFWVLINVATLIYGLLNEDGEGVFQLLLLAAVISAPIGFLVGVYGILFALGLYALFRQQSWLR